MWTRQVHLPWKVLSQMQWPCGQGGNHSCSYFAVEFSPEVNGEATPAQICSENSTRCRQKNNLTWYRNLFLLLLFQWPPSRTGLCLGKRSQNRFGSYLILFHTNISYKPVKPLGFWPWNVCRAQYRAWKEGRKQQKPSHHLLVQIIFPAKCRFGTFSK